MLRLCNWDCFTVIFYIIIVLSIKFIIYQKNIIIVLCFQDEMIYIHRNWILDGETKIIPRNLHVQFHGREMHSLCFVSENLQLRADGKHNHYSRFSWIANGCEDGTVRLTRYGNAHFTLRI